MHGTYVITVDSSDFTYLQYSKGWPESLKPTAGHSVCSQCAHTGMIQEQIICHQSSKLTRSKVKTNQTVVSCLFILQWGEHISQHQQTPLLPGLSWPESETSTARQQKEGQKLVVETHSCYISCSHCSTDLYRVHGLNQPSAA